MNKRSAKKLKKEVVEGFQPPIHLFLNWRPPPPPSLPLFPPSEDSDWFNLEKNGNEFTFLIKPKKIGSTLLFTEKDFATLIYYVNEHEPKNIIFEYVKIESKNLTNDLINLLSKGSIELLDFGGDFKFFFSRSLDHQGLRDICNVLVHNDKVKWLRLSSFDFEKSIDAVIRLVKENRTIESLLIKFNDNYETLRAVLQFNNTITKLYLQQPCPFVCKEDQEIEVDFQELAFYLKISLSENSHLNTIFFQRGVTLIHREGIPIPKKS